MATIVTRRAYWGLFTMGFVLVSSIGLFAQTSSPAAFSVPRDLNSTLAELTRVAPATIQDLDLASQQQGGIHRITFWRGNKAYDPQTTEALRRNLQLAVPNLIHDTQASGGTISTAFKLYKDLAVVCDSLGSLLPPGARDNKSESPLNNDLTDMNRLKEELSSYIERSAASLESRTSPTLSIAGRPPKKVIVDNDMPEHPSPKKHVPPNQ